MTISEIYTAAPQQASCETAARAFALLDELGIPCEKLPYESYLNPVVELPREQR